MTTHHKFTLARPFELRSGRSKWQNRWHADDVWLLLTAAWSGDVATVKKLLTREPTLVHAKYWYTSPLRLAAQRGHHDVVIELLEHEHIWAEDPMDNRENIAQIATDHGHHELAAHIGNQNSALVAQDREIHHAVQRCDMDQVRAILAEDISNVDLTGVRMKTPLHYAVENEDTSMIELLVEEGAQLDPIAYSSHSRLGTPGFRPLASALWHHGFWRQRNNFEIANYLITNGASYTLPIAAASGDLNQVERLLRLKADPNFEEPCGKRALSAAAERNHQDVVQLLLDNGADPNLPEGPYCPDGYALWSAARFGHKEIVQMLLEHDANPNAQVDSSGSPIEATKDVTIRELLSKHGGRISMVAHFHNKNYSAVKDFLNNHPARMTETDIGQGFTAAVSNSDKRMIQLLLNRGFKVPANLTICQTYLWQDLKLAELLLRSGMDPNLPNWQRVTPLHHMASKGNIAAAELFLRYGADPTLVDLEYWTTPLGWAAREGKVDFVRFLIAHDSRLRHDHLEYEDHRIIAPLQWAIRRDHQAIVELLE